MDLCTIVGNLNRKSRRGLLTRCQNTGTKLLLSKQCKQLSLLQALTLGWPLVLSLALPLEAEAEVVVEAEVQTAVLSDRLPAKGNDSPVLC